MNATFKHFDLELISPSFDSELTDTLIELNHLRKLRLGGTTKPRTFFQLKEIFHLLESVGSARIEGNRTTISEYVEQKIANNQNSSERFSEIANVEEAMSYIEEQVKEGSEITHRFIRELHQITVNTLTEEGDETPGAYRSRNVKIAKATHLPPDFNQVQIYMDELLVFINAPCPEKYQLIKTAQAHHRFAWIHPFGNGNGRVVRLLTYALLIKYGFNVQKGKLLNPTAVFCNDRDKYYEMLAKADEGTEASILLWCEYVLKGIFAEISKINQLLDYEYLSKNVLTPVIELCNSRGLLEPNEVDVLRIGVNIQEFKLKDLKDEPFKELTQRQKQSLLARIKARNLIQPLREGGREYFVNFMNNFLMRSLISVLEKEGFIPSIDK
jgi:Fic family protein